MISSLLSLKRRAFILHGVLLCVTIALILLLKKSFDWDTLSHPDRAKIDVRCGQPGVSTSRLLGGLPGFTVLENVWYKDKTLYLFSSNATGLPDRDRVVSGETGYEVLPWSSEGDLAGAREATCLAGTTLFINDGGVQGLWSHLSHFFHFTAEILLGGLVALSSAVPSSSAVPRWAIIPWEDEWRDRAGLNDVVAKGIFGDGLIERAKWEAMTTGSAGKINNGWIAFDRVVIIDRWASHRHNPFADAWNKMAIPLLSHNTPQSFFALTRAALFQSLRIAVPPPRRRRGASLQHVPKVIYVDRQASSRALFEKDHEDLLSLLALMEDDGSIEVEHVKLETMGKKKQIKTFADADIIIGIHGSGLTHEIWMPEGGVLVELFPPGVFIRDYESTSAFMSHIHYGVWEDRVVHPEEWSRTGRKGEEEELHDGTQIPVDPIFIRLLLEEIVQGMKA